MEYQNTFQWTHNIPQIILFLHLTVYPFHWIGHIHFGINTKQDYSCLVSQRDWIFVSELGSESLMFSAPLWGLLQEYFAFTICSTLHTYVQLYRYHPPNLAAQWQYVTTDVKSSFITWQFYLCTKTGNNNITLFLPAISLSLSYLYKKKKQ
jgi:hypothetical protein